MRKNSVLDKAALAACYGRFGGKICALFLEAARSVGYVAQFNETTQNVKLTALHRTTDVNMKALIDRIILSPGGEIDPATNNDIETYNKAIGEITATLCSLNDKMVKESQKCTEKE